MSEEEFILKHGNTPMSEVKDVVHYVQGYDPAKAREYYLRTRQLKGRKRAAAPSPKGYRPKRRATPPTSGVSGTQLQQRAAVEQRVARIKGRFEKLQKLVQEMEQQALATAGSKRLTRSKKRLGQQTNDLNAKISKARADLKSAVAKARPGSANKTPAAQSRRNS